MVNENKINKIFSTIFSNIIAAFHIEETSIWFTLYTKWVASIWNVTLDWNWFRKERAFTFLKTLQNLLTL